MKKRIYVSVAALLALAGFELYMRTQVDLSSDTVTMCYSSREILPYQEVYGNITYDSVYHTFAGFKLNAQHGPPLPTNYSKTEYRWPTFSLLRVRPFVLK